MAVTKTESIYDIIRDELSADPFRQDVDIAMNVLLARLDLEIGPAELLKPLVTDEVRRLRRNEDRRAERAAFSPGPKVYVESAQKLLLGEGHSFVLENGTRIAWLDATSAQHRERARWQERLRDGIQKDIDVHYRCADLIDAAGVANLREWQERNPNKVIPVT